MGRGEIGSAVKEVIEKYDHVSTYDIKGKNGKVPNTIHVMHICFPYSDKFVEQVQNYVTRYEPIHLLVWSTVPIGTCRKLNATHTPVEGRHPKLAESMRKMRRWIGNTKASERKFFLEYFVDRDFSVQGVNDSRHTEFLKLRSTSRFGINLVFADYEKKIADDIGMDWEHLKHFDTNYNRLYRDLGMDWAQRYILDPPQDGLGGHCLIENGVLLDEQYPNKLLKAMLGLGKHISTISEDKPYRNRAWLYAEYVGKEKSTEQIGSEWGCTGANIIRIMKLLNIPRRDSKWSDQEITDLERLSVSMTFKEMAEHLGRSYEAIRIQASKMAVESVYNPGERDDKTRQKISATLQGITIEEWDGFKESVNSLIRKSEAMQNWRKAVFERDDYTCQHCGTRGGQGKTVILHADHIKRFADYPELRFDLNNGRTLCVDCHRKTPTWGGRKQNDCIRQR